MQNRYVGDIGDFGKYGLLRALCRPEPIDGPSLRLGVVWYFTSDEKYNNDGRHIGYLDPTPKNVMAFRQCDRELYDKLGDIVRSDARQVSSIRHWVVLPEETVYYDVALDFRAKQIHPNTATRVQARQEWVQDALLVTKNCDIVFVDPDNGIGSTVQAHSRLGAKYVLLDELIPYLDRDQTLVIYHHLNRLESAESQVARRLVELRERLNPAVTVLALRYRRGSARVFLVCLSVDHHRVLADRIDQMMDSSWNRHFTRYNPPATQ